MPETMVRGVATNFETFGSDGAWISLSPGARKGFAELVPVAKDLAAKGFRVLLHDRRNCGASDVAFDAPGTESEIWADDLSGLADSLGIDTLYVGGASSGARLAITFAIRHPERLRGLLLWKITGGSHAVRKLAETYYGSFAALAKGGGMAAVCASDHFKACIAARPSNHAKLMAIDPGTFADVMQGWRDEFLRSASLPIIGATTEELAGIASPACIIAGNDKVHTPQAARNLHKALAGSELFDDIVSTYADADLPDEPDQAEWQSKEPQIVRIFSEFLGRRAV